MKALSLWQPWASLMADGRKKIETRHWRPPAWLLGQPLAIHATMRVDSDACEDFGYDPLTIPRGCVVAIDPSIQFDLRNSSYSYTWRDGDKVIFVDVLRHGGY